MNKFITVLTVIFLVFSFSCVFGADISQSNNNKLRDEVISTWEAIIGGMGYQEARDVVEVEDGYVFVGVKKTENDKRDIYLFKLGKGGNLIWQKTLGNESYDEIAFGIEEGVGGGFIICGGILYTPGGYGSGYVVKTNDSGDFEWDEVYPGQGYGSLLYDIKKNVEGGYITAGYVGVNPYVLDNDGWLLKIDETGGVVGDWDYGYEIPGGFRQQGFKSVDTCRDGGYIAVGSSNAPPGPYYDKAVFVVKVTASGQEQWEKYLGTTDIDEAGEGIVQANNTPNNEYVLVGSAFPPEGVSVYFVRLDQNGDEIRQRYLNVGGSDYGRSIQHTLDGGYIITGEKYLSSPQQDSNIILLKTDADGVIVWPREFGEEAYDTAYAVLQTSDKGYIVAGNTNWETSGDRCDAYLIKTNSKGRVIGNVIPSE